MNVYIVGLPESGRTTVAKEFSKHSGHIYVDATYRIEADFQWRFGSRIQNEEQYEEEYNQYLLNSIKTNPLLCVDYVANYIKHTKSGNGDYLISGENINFVIDNVYSPKDFVHLFDYTKDVVVFLNRTDNEAEVRTYENIGVSVIRDYCYWLASASLLDKTHWLEYNFKIPGDDSDSIKTLGSKNSVFIVRSLNKVMSHLKETLCK